jgi:molybdopterin molybdotransferase
MVTVAEAEKIVLSEIKDFGTEEIPFEEALGRVLAKDIVADRDLPPYNRVAMDGIAINFAAFTNKLRSFRIKGMQLAGDAPIAIASDECVEIMTGAALPDAADTVIRYEDLNLQNGTATITIEDIRKGQNIHVKGIDKKQNDVVATAGQYIHPALINVAVSVGKTKLPVKKLPKVVVIATGNELVSADTTPLPYEVRRSNDVAIKMVLQQYGLQADSLHLPDDKAVIEQQLGKCLSDYDVVILSGGISKGKSDHIPEVLEQLKVKQLFYQVQQRPGKPFWFGKHEKETLVFAFPGNPVSTFLCLHRYFLPWLESSSGVRDKQELYAVLDKEVNFKPALQYFLQVKLHTNNEGKLVATPIEGHGSGDYANLVDADAFMELPAEKTNFNKGEVYRIWPFKPI